MMGALKQLIMLPVIWSMNKVDWTNEDNILYLRCAAVVVFVAGMTALQVRRTPPRAPASSSTTRDPCGRS